MKVTYFIFTGTPCEVYGTGITGASLKEAIQDFKDYVEDCKRFGNEYKDAFMQVVSDKWPERTYVVGQKGGIVKLE